MSSSISSQGNFWSNFFVVDRLVSGVIISVNVEYFISFDSIFRLISSGSFPIGSHDSKNYQHRGFGKLLISEDERITTEEFHRPRILVISGVGVREYFRKLSFERYGPYIPGIRWYSTLSPAFLASSVDLTISSIPCPR